MIFLNFRDHNHSLKQHDDEIEFPLAFGVCFFFFGATADISAVYLAHIQMTFQLVFCSEWIYGVYHFSYTMKIIAVVISYEKYAEVAEKPLRVNIYI